MTGRASLVEISEQWTLWDLHCAHQVLDSEAAADRLQARRIEQKTRQ